MCHTFSTDSTTAPAASDPSSTTTSRTLIQGSINTTAIACVVMLTVRWSVQQYNWKTSARGFCYNNNKHFPLFISTSAVIVWYNDIWRRKDVILLPVLSLFTVSLLWYFLYILSTCVCLWEYLKPIVISKCPILITLVHYFIMSLGRK